MGEAAAADGGWEAGGWRGPQEESRWYAESVLAGWPGDGVLRGSKLRLVWTPTLWPLDEQGPVQDRY